MKTIKYLLLTIVFFCSMPACMDLDIPPVNVVTDVDVFGTENGIRSFFARVYAAMPIEDFRFSHGRGINQFYTIAPICALTGEAFSRDISSSNTETHNYWSEAYSICRDLHYFIATLPSYKEIGGYSDEQINEWFGECYFIRAMTYFAMVKRYGGVPIVDRVLDYFNESLESFDIPRASEEEVYDFICADFDKAYQLLPNISSDNTPGVARANKYTAMGFKSRAALYAGCIALYNTIELYDGSKRLCGIPSSRAADYFQQSYNAAKILEGRYELYKKSWSAGSKEAQYQNFVNLFFDDSSPENIFVREFGYPNSVHGYDCYYVTYQYMTSNYSAYICPTLSFVEMFDGLPKNANGQVDVFDDQGHYKLYDNVYDFFAEAEPRLRATVLFPGDLFKGEALDMYRGIYIEPVGAGIEPLLPEGSSVRYNTLSSLVTSSDNTNQNVVVDNKGIAHNAGGKSGYFNEPRVSCLGGFGMRKLLNPNMPPELVYENRSDQNWVELRYAEVLLNRAEAAFELYLMGQGEQYRTDAYECIIPIQERAGAEILPSSTDLTLDLVRKERRKELAFEHKAWWDLKRWRIFHIEQSNTRYRSLMPFYVLNEDKWFFDARLDERNANYTFNTRWYYKEIPDARIAESPSLIQNPGY